MGRGPAGFLIFRFLVLCCVVLGGWVWSSIVMSGGRDMGGLIRHQIESVGVASVDTLQWQLQKDYSQVMRMMQVVEKRLMC